MKYNITYRSTSNELIIFTFKGGGLGPKFKKHDLKITVDPKVPPSWPIFWLGMKDPDHNGHLW